jgi:outer membrane biosynthesis protein TonB
MRVKACLIALMFGISLTGVALARQVAVATQAQTPQRALPKPVFVEPEYFLRKHLHNLTTPAYPLTAQESGIQGEVVVFVWYDKGGNLVEAHPLVSPDESLSKEVLKMLKESKVTVYAPYDPEVNYMSELRFVFSMEDGKADVHNAPETEQRKVSAEFTLEMKRRAEKSKER